MNHSCCLGRCRRHLFLSLSLFLSPTLALFPACFRRPVFLCPPPFLLHRAPMLVRRRITRPRALCETTPAACCPAYLPTAATKPKAALHRASASALERIFLFTVFGGSSKERCTGGELRMIMREREKERKREASSMEVGSRSHQAHRNSPVRRPLGQTLHKCQRRTRGCANSQQGQSALSTTRSYKAAIALACQRKAWSF